MLSVFGIPPSMILLAVFTLSSTEHLTDTSTDSNHAFYLSVIDVISPVEEGKTALNIKVFSDDLQNAVSEFYQFEKLIRIEGLCEDDAELAAAYLEKHLHVVLDEKKTALVFQGCRQEGDSHWLSFEIADQPWKSVSITADFFMELFPTQTHVVNVTRAGQSRYAQLTKANQMCRFD